MIPEPNRARNGKALQQETSPLVSPGILPEPQFAESPPVLELCDAGGNEKKVGNGVTDPLIQGLIDRLPTPDTTWSLDDRAKWLRTASSIFVLIYKTADDEDGDIRLVLAKDGVGNSAV